MTEEIAIVGDVHGNLNALEQIIEAARKRAAVLTFVGDYINRGPHSASVINYLVHLDADPERTIFLRGHHETAFLRYLDGGLIADFLKMGGAATLKSYSLGDLPITDFRSAVPPTHVEFLRTLRGHFRARELLVTHSLNDPVPVELADSDIPFFRVAGHLPQRSRMPLVTEAMALIDTGCGTWDDGPLTCYFWPTGDWIQSI